MNIKFLILLWALLGAQGASAYCTLYQVRRADFTLTPESVFRGIPFEQDARRRWVFETFEEEMKALLDKGEITVSTLKNVDFLPLVTSMVIRM